MCVKRNISSRDIVNTSVTHKTNVLMIAVLRETECYLRSEVGDNTIYCIQKKGSTPCCVFSIVSAHVYLLYEQNAKNGF